MVEGLLPLAVEHPHLLRAVAGAGGGGDGAFDADEDVGAPDLLRRYQRQRRPDNLLMLAATDALDRLFSNDNPLLRLARDTGIAAVHRAPPLKRLFMRQAMGAPLFSRGADRRQELVDVAPQRL
jgi:2-octaprenyl-6-methoxyphenol hydroxylase